MQNVLKLGRHRTNPKFTLCVKVSCLLFRLDLLQSIFCHSEVLVFHLLSMCLFKRLLFKSTDLVTGLFKFGFLYVSRSLAQAGY